jgi:hypothetical protein
VLYLNRDNSPKECIGIWNGLKDFKIWTETGIISHFGQHVDIYFLKIIMNNLLGKHKHTLRHETRKLSKATHLNSDSAPLKGEADSWIKTKCLYYSKKVNEIVNGRINGWMDACMHGWMDGCMDWWTDKWADKNSF